MLLIRRRVALLSRFDPGARDRAIKKQLVELEDDEEKRRTWFADQYLHPHEIDAHRSGGVAAGFARTGIDYVSSFPKIELFGSMPKRIFRARQVARFRSSPVAHLLVQLTWILTQNAGGGYFVLVGRKNVR